MDIKIRLPLFLLAMGIAVALLLAPPVSYAKATVTVLEKTVNADFYEEGTLDPLGDYWVEGHANVKVQIVETPSGSFNVNLHYVLYNTKGEYLDFPDGPVPFVGSFVQNDNVHLSGLGGTETITYEFKSITKGPYPNVVISETYHVTVTPDGDVIVNFDKIKVRAE